MMLTKDRTHLEAAYLYSRLSKCKRQQVGCVAVRDNRVVSVGYNGTIPGQPNCCEDENNNTKDTVLHAEENLVAFSSKNGIPLNDCTLYITMAPCIRCARLLVAAGIKEVFYMSVYRETSGVEFLNKIGIKTTQMKE